MFGSDEEELEDDVVENSEEEVQEVEKLPVFPSRKYKVSKIITTTYEAGDYIGNLSLNYCIDNLLQINFNFRNQE